MTLEEVMRKYKKARKKYWPKTKGLEKEYVTMDENGYFVGRNGEYVIFDPTFLGDDWEEYKEDILDKEEKEYLRAVIKPFRDRITYIAKVEEDIHWFYSLRIRVDIGFLNDYYDFCLPPFEETSDMYKNMEVGKEYTLKELNL